MPRISEPTVAEHRARQLRTLLDAARALVAEEGIEALSLAALARRVGLSRPSLYEYFRSKDDLVAAIVEEELPRWAALVEQALTGPPDLVGKVEAYVRAQLEVMTDGRHAAAVQLVEHALAEPARERIREGHAQLLRPLVDALKDAGLPDPELRAGLVQGIVDAAAALATRTPASAATVVDTAVAQAVHGLTPPKPAQPRP
ncbi:TetR/AcrR family transcriptional regulator [Actinomadura rupiterrae]|uniref:TetR/AcrR family transcriptional regulator n=1 Tax=Actinomadura rupiterrae TaxID=559627 RepID=UPI0020A4B1FA|nr:TetR/AcrR family transcriptional regulator [Actinomadura rupiterrae]MCP2336242.1 AcrR family transcriptional regulator [Actinomadura rupiterrae]